jgi:hypothetical protein
MNKEQWFDIEDLRDEDFALKLLLGYLVAQAGGEVVISIADLEATGRHGVIVEDYMDNGFIKLTALPPEVEAGVEAARQEAMRVPGIPLSGSIGSLKITGVTGNIKTTSTTNATNWNSSFTFEEVK